MKAFFLWIWGLLWSFLSLFVVFFWSGLRFREKEVQREKEKLHRQRRRTSQVLAQREHIQGMELNEKIQRFRKKS